MSMGTNYISKPEMSGKERGTPYGDSFDAQNYTQFSSANTSRSLSQSAADGSMMTVARFGVGLAGIMSEHVLSHPCIVIRHQSQVHHDSQWYHLTPFTLFPTIYHIQKNQSVTTLWKGIGSALMVKGMAVATESAVSEFTPFPKEVSRHTSVKKLAEHILLKSIGFIVTTPFYAASLVETVQSEIASERPGVFDCLKEGFGRVMSLGSPPSTRLLPMWKLFVPVVSHGVLHYVISSLARYTVVLSMRKDDVDAKLSGTNLLEESQPQANAYNTFYPELVGTFTGHLLADIMLYPLETILHRLCMQGTRTIIDNTDTGLGVIPIITRYTGAVDCLKSIISEEGVSGLYKGFGAMILQYCMHVVVLRISKFVLDSMSSAESSKPILASELALRQQRLEQKQSIRHVQGDNAANASFRTGYNSGGGGGVRYYQNSNVSNASFNFESAYATSTPYDTPLAAPQAVQRLRQGDTNTGAGRVSRAARPL